MELIFICIALQFVIGFTTCFQLNKTTYYSITKRNFSKKFLTTTPETTSAHTKTIKNIYLKQNVSANSHTNNIVPSSNMTTSTKIIQHRPKILSIKRQLYSRLLPLKVNIVTNKKLDRYIGIKIVRVKNSTNNLTSSIPNDVYWYLLPNGTKQYFWNCQPLPFCHYEAWGSCKSIKTKLCNSCRSDICLTVFIIYCNLNMINVVLSNFHP